MTGCRHCNFQILKVPDLITKDGEIHYVHVLKSKKRIHDCVFLPKRIPEYVRYFSNDLPTIQFLKADNVLKRRFYEICPPIQRKKLWNCSKTCANLGRKPITFIVGAFTSLFFAEHVPESSSTIMNAFHMIQSTNTIVSTRKNRVLLDNFVMDLRYEFDFGFDSKRMAELTRFVEFNQTKVCFDNDRDLTNFYPLIFTPKVTTLLLWDASRDLSPIWPLLPNLDDLTTDSCIPPSLFKEFTHCPKLSSIDFPIAEHLDYSMIAELLRNQQSNLWFTFHCSVDLDLNEKSLLQHFVPVEEQMWDQKGLCFMISDVDDQFFVLR